VTENREGICTIAVLLIPDDSVPEPVVEETDGSWLTRFSWKMDLK